MAIKKWRTESQYPLDDQRDREESSVTTRYPETVPLIGVL
jgi:hypothetical protein